MWHMYNEKVYFKDEHVKVTNLRVTCHHITVPIDKIDAVKVNFKIGTMTVAFTILILILVPAVCFFLDYPFGWLGIIFLPVLFLWIRIVYKTYTELKITTKKGMLNFLRRTCI